MKIAIIGNPVTDISSGKFLLKFSRIISELAQDVYVINDGRLRIKDKKIHVIRATYFNSRIRSEKKSALDAFLGFFAAQIGLTFGLFRCVRKIDTVFILPGTMFIPTLFAKIARKRTFLYEAQDVIWEYVKAKESIGALLRFCVLWNARNMVLCLTDYMTVEGKNVINQNLLEKYRSKIHVCPLYIDIGRYNIKKQSRERKDLVGFVASIDRRKGILEFVAAARQLCRLQEKLRFVIAGRGPLLNQVRKALEDLVACNTIQIIESIPEESFSDFLNELRLYVLPSISEGLPNTILEAMACGTPILATPVGAIPDILKDGENGFIMENNSPECIAKNIIRVLGFDNLEKISENARSLVEKQYCYEAAVERYKKIICCNGC